MNHSLISPGMVVTPDEKIVAANSFLSREANRLSLPFVSIEKSQKSETGRVAGNTYRPVFVPLIVGAIGQSRPDEKVAQFVVHEIAKRQGVETALIGLANMASAKLAQAEAMILDENLAKSGGFLGDSATPVAQAQRQRLDNFLQDLLWMAFSLRQRRENMLSN